MPYNATKPRQVSVLLGKPYETAYGKLIPQHLTIDIDGDTLPELIEKLSVLQSTHGKGLTLRIDTERDTNYDGDFAINVVGWRDETPTEVQERLAQEQKRQEYRAWQLDEQIERLKQQRAQLAGKEFS